MKLIKIKTLIFILQFILSMNLAAQNPLDSVLKTLPGRLESLMDQRGWPGMSAAVVYEDNIVLLKAFGQADIDNNILTTTKTIYPAGSITKLFISTMLMKLSEAGRLRIDDPINQYLDVKGIKSPYSDSVNLTFGQLASHTSGLPVDATINFWHYYSYFLWVVLRGNIDIEWYIGKEELIKSLNTVELEYLPDRYANYSNFGVQLLGIALENIVEQDFDIYIKNNILDPLGMENSYFFPTQDVRKKIAIGYDYFEPDFKRAIAPEWKLGCAEYSGGLYSTPEDLARFLILHFGTSKSSNPDVLSSKSIRIMQKPRSLPKPDSNESYGLGWSISKFNGYQIIAHAGSHTGYYAKIEALPELKLGVIIMTNARYPQGSIGPERSLNRIILDELLPHVINDRSAGHIKSEIVDIKHFAGIYELAGKYAGAEIIIKDKILYLKLIQQSDFNEAFQRVGSLNFCFASDPYKKPMLMFKRAENGKISGFTFLSNYFKKQ